MSGNLKKLTLEYEVKLCEYVIDLYPTIRLRLHLRLHLYLRFFYVRKYYPRGGKVFLLCNDHQWALEV